MLNEAGFVLVAFALLITLGLVFKVLLSLSQLSLIWQATLIAVFVFLIHYNRKDLIFLQTNLQAKSLRLLLVYEYVFLTLFLILFFVYNTGMLSLLLVIVPIVLGLFSPILLKTRLIRKGLGFNFIANRFFEIKSFFRRNSIVVSFAFILSILSFVHVSIFILSSIIWATLIISIYDRYEPKEFIRPEGFLSNKIGSNLACISVVFAPMFLVSLIFLSEYRWLILYVYVSYLILITLAIVYKYSNYHPLKHMIRNSSMQSLMVAFFILPGFGIANFMLMVYYSFKANANIKSLYA